MPAVILCRSFHPLGYGGFSGKRRRYVRDVQPMTEGHSYTLPATGHWEDTGELELGAAHGYVTVIVLCDQEPDVDAVLESAYQGFVWPDRHRDGWYDAGVGQLDCVAIVPHLPALVDMVRVGTAPVPRALPAYHSLGDNRAVAVLTARQFLERDA